MGDTSYGYKSSEVLRDTIISADNFYYIVNVAFSGKPFSGDSIKLLRYDTLMNSIIEYDYNITSGESVFLRLDALKNECWNYFFTEVCCNLVDTSMVFGQIKTRKGFSTYSGPTPPFWVYILMKDIGPTSIFDDQSWGFTVFTQYDLVYARINGVEYGQVVSIDEDKLKLPTSFYLYQNYPNPFNPTTTISWQSPIYSRQLIKVYDVLGNEITTLIDEYKPAGSYEIKFDAAQLSSGVYFYKLQTSGFVETKKMILIR